MFTLKGGAEIHIQSFGIFNLTLWDDVMAQFQPLTPQDVIYVGEKRLLCEHPPLLDAAAAALAQTLV